MSRISECFMDNRKKLVAFTVSCDPDYINSLRIVYELIENGADMIELGIPFSDPIADGTVIQEAYRRARMNGFVIEKSFNMVKEIRERYETPLLFLTYYNIIYRYGVERFLERCSSASIDGLVIPDLPFEEQKEILHFSKNNNVSIIPMVSVTSGNRLKHILKNVEGFIYCVSSTGVTGKRAQLLKDAAGFSDMISSVTDTKKAVGFGIYDPEQVAILKRHFDGVIVGSAFVELIGKYKAEEAITKIGKLASILKNELLRQD